MECVIVAKLDTLIQVQKPVESNQSGHVSTSWSNFKTAWCTFRLRNIDFYINGVYVLECRAVLSMWQDDTIDLNQRVVINNIPYEITDIQPSKIRNRMEIQARKV